MNNMYCKVIRPILDTMLSLIGLILFSWLFLLIVIAIEIDDPGHVFFTQERIGIHKRHFKLYKFRSMKMSTPHDVPTHLLENPDQYITRIGSFIRKTSLDEIPQLINILKQDMSIIGPRPLLVKYLPLYNDFQKHRHDVRPGLTGYAQVNGRNSISWEERFKLDVDYVQNITFMGDVKIIFDTVYKVFKRDGISSGTSVTMEEFKGS